MVEITSVSDVEEVIESGGNLNISEGNISVKVQTLSSDSTFWSLTICAGVLILANTLISSALYFKMCNLQITSGHDNIEMFEVDKLSLE